MMSLSATIQSMTALQRIILFCSVVLIFCCVISDCALFKIFSQKIVQEHFQDADTKMTNLPQLTLYYTTWCPFSIEIMKEWEKVAQMYLGTGMQITAVDCDMEPEKMKAANVSGFPTVVLTRNGVSTEYKGVRQAPAIARFVELS